MATIQFNDVGIRAMSACVPKKIVSNKDSTCTVEKVTAD